MKYLTLIALTIALPAYADTDSRCGDCPKSIPTYTCMLCEDQLAEDDLECYTQWAVDVVLCGGMPSCILMANARLDECLSHACDRWDACTAQLAIPERLPWEPLWMPLFTEWHSVQDHGNDT